MKAIIALSCCLLLAALSFAVTGYDHSPTLGPAKGSLIIVGGGNVAQEIRSRFVELAGGREANFVVIPTAGADNEFKLAEVGSQFTKYFNVEHVTVLHTRDRKQANSREFVAPLRNATAVWIEGGRQWRLADAYLGTAVEREIKALLARGGVVAGSSAGATIQGSYLVRGQSAVPGNPDGDNTVMMSPGHEKGFGLLEKSAIDQHVIRRHRESDLDAVIVAHPNLLGIGIDESTAIVVHGNEFEVIGDSKVIIHDNRKHEDGKMYYFLSHGQKFNLKTRAVVGG